MNSRTLINSYEAKVQTSPFTHNTALNANSEYSATVNVYEYTVTYQGSSYETTKTSTGKGYVINGKEYGPEFAREIN